MLTEKQERNLIDRFVENYLIKEAAMDTFSLENLSKIRSFAGKLKYCKEQLGMPIGGGTSRIVFQIDDEKVLKLAKNPKGLAQNEQEEREYCRMFDSVLARVYEHAEDYSWIVAEYVLPAQTSDFKHVTGMSFKEFCDALKMMYNNYCSPLTRRYDFNKPIEDEGAFWDKIYDHEWLTEINDFLCNTQYFGIGDLLRIANWGLSQRDGEDVLVILDNGLSEEVYRTHYDKHKPKPAFNPWRW